MVFLVVNLAFASCEPAPSSAPATLQLFTMAPGADLFSSMGHSALVFSGDGVPHPIVFDWGAYAQDGTPVQFLLGRLPFELRAQPWAGVRLTMEHQDRSTVLQTLDVPPEQVRLLRDQLSAQLGEPYTYHWGQANCATRARDRLVDIGAIARDDRPASTTARFEAQRHLRPWPVLGFAWSFLTSSALDRPLTRFERGMIPERLMELTPAERCVTPRSRGFAARSPPPSWPWMLPGLLGSAAVLGAAASGRVQWVGGLAVVCGAVFGVLGTAGLALWAASTMEGIGPTANWWFAGPHSFLLMLAGAQLFRGHDVSRWTWAIPLSAALLGALWQLTLSAQHTLPALPALLPAVLATSLALASTRSTR